jgi:hypothetical protein
VLTEAFATGLNPRALKVQAPTCAGEDLRGCASYARAGGELLF